MLGQKSVKPHLHLQDILVIYTSALALDNNKDILLIVGFTYNICTDMQCYSYLLYTLADMQCIYVYSISLTFHRQCNITLFYAMAFPFNLRCESVTLTPYNNLKVTIIFMKGFMASILQKLVKPIFGHCNLSIPQFKHFIENPPHSRNTQQI